MVTRRVPNAGGGRRQRGVAYIAVMLAVAVVGLVAAYSVRAGAALSQHDAEEELLVIGLEFQLALQRYASATPGGAPGAPQTLEELLRDPRHPGLVRHLRRIPADPFTGEADWVLVRDPRNLIIGVHSNSLLKPLKVSGFVPALSRLEGEHDFYRDWVFYGFPPWQGGTSQPPH